MLCSVSLVIVVVFTAPGSVSAATIPEEFENKPPSDPDAGPKDVHVANYTSNSITLGWNFSEPQTEGYRFYYKHGNFTDVKTVRSSATEYTLTGLNPFTTYEIWLEGVLDGNRRSSPSERISAHTDVGRPGPPSITNATCHGTGSIFVEWTRPDVFHKSIDYYKIFHRTSDQPAFQTVTVRSNSGNETENFVIGKLDGNRDHVVKVCAETRSLAAPDTTWVGEASGEVTVFLPSADCEGSLSSGELGAGMVAGVLGAVLFVIVAVLGPLVWRRYFKAAYYYLDEPQRPCPPSSSSKGIPDGWENELGPDGQVGPVPVGEFEAHVARNHADGDSGFSKEYGEIQKLCATKSMKATHEHSSHPDNKCKNRYLNIVAYDHTRVKLLAIPGQKKTSDYINANYIDGFRRCNAYIGTQGPLDETRESFWRMVWEQNVHVVVMITNLVERGRRKCDIYWPKEDTESYGQVEAQLEKEEVMADYTVRTIKLKHLKKDGGGGGDKVSNVTNTLKKRKGNAAAHERVVKQFHYTSWPDHGVPCHPLPVLTFIRKSSEANRSGDGPIIVHCSAGVGRTGTYIAIDAMLSQVKSSGQLNVYGFLKHIRGQRNHLVQTEEQYVFIHDALVEALRSGNTEISEADLSGYASRLRDVELQHQFDLITSFVPADYQYASAWNDANGQKNRDPGLVPVEPHRVPLAPRPGVEGSDYVNASWLNGHAKPKEFVVTQHPLASTMTDFWRMLWDHNAQTVVLLSSTTTKAHFPAFWPDGDADDLDCETFRVRFVERTLHEGHSTFDLVASSQHDDYELAVRIIHCPECIRAADRVFSVLRLVQDWHLEYQDGPLVVVDELGGTEAATFCALTTLHKQLESVDSVDVYQVAKLYHNRRPGVWKTPDDVLHLYEAMLALVESKCSNPLQEVATMKDSNPDRRHSASASSSNLMTMTTACNGSRRHSLPRANSQSDPTAVAFSSLPPVTNKPAKENGCQCDDEEYDNDDDESETVALTQGQTN